MADAQRHRLREADPRLKVSTFQATSSNWRSLSSLDERRCEDLQEDEKPHVLQTHGTSDAVAHPPFKGEACVEQLDFSEPGF